jgi:hypothetical protein
MFQGIKLGRDAKKTVFALYCARLFVSLRLCLLDRMHLRNENKWDFILHFVRFSLSLQPKGFISAYCEACGVKRERLPSVFWALNNLIGFIPSANCEVRGDLKRTNTTIYG